VEGGPYLHAQVSAVRLSCDLNAKVVNAGAAGRLVNNRTGSRGHRSRGERDRHRPTPFFGRPRRKIFPRGRGCALKRARCADARVTFLGRL
jgi:hypothetical protein